MAIRFTHGFDLLHKIGGMVGGLALVALGAELIEPIAEPFRIILQGNDLGWAWVILVIAYGIAGYLGAVFLLCRTVWPTWLPTWLHVRASLWTRVTPVEAAKLGFLFDGSLDGRWFPMGAIRRISPEYRREALFRFANKIAQDEGWRRPFSMSEDHVARNGAARQGRRDSTSEKEGAAQDGRSRDDQYARALGILGLGVGPNEFSDIRSAYRKKISEFHPDKFSGARPEVVRYSEEMSKSLNAAYEYLEKKYAEDRR